MSQQEEKPDLVRVPHPSDDGTWVEFHGVSQRQLEVLKHYEEIWDFINKHKTVRYSNERYLD